MIHNLIMNLFEIFLPDECLTTLCNNVLHISQMLNGKVCIMHDG